MASQNVQPTKSENAVIVEYVAHPQARMYVGTEKPVVYDLTPPQPFLHNTQDKLPRQGGSSDGTVTVSGQGDKSLDPVTVPTLNRGGLGWGFVAPGAYRPAEGSGC